MKHVGALLVGLLLLVSSCDSNAVFKDIEDIEDGKWFVKQAPSFTFMIEDTTRTYSIFYNIRNSLSYPYYNLYISRVLLDATGKKVESKLDELILLDPKTGKPFGDGLGDLFDHKIRVVKAFRFPRRGAYTVRLRQYMRQNPLPEIYSVGISVEKEL